MYSIHIIMMRAWGKFEVSPPPPNKTNRQWKRPRVEPPATRRPHTVTAPLWNYMHTVRYMPSQGQGQPPCQKSRSQVKRFSHESADRQTDRQTHGTDNITSSANEGGNKINKGIPRNIFFPIFASQYDYWKSLIPTPILGRNPSFLVFLCIKLCSMYKKSFAWVLRTGFSLPMFKYPLHTNENIEFLEFNAAL